MHGDFSKLDLRGWQIAGKLTTNTLISNSVSGSVGTGEDGPAIIPLGGNASLGFNLSGSYTDTRTTTGIIDFAVTSRAASTQICEKIASSGGRVTSVGSLGIRKWIQSIEAAERGEPRIGVTSLSYTLIFGVARTGAAGAQIVVVPMKATAAAAASRNDTQTLVLTMAPAKAVSKKGAGKVGKKGGVIRFFNLGGTSPALRLEELEQKKLFVPQ